MHTSAFYRLRVPTAFWWIVAACFLAYSWQHLAAETMPALQTAAAAPAVTEPIPDLNNLLASIDQTSQAAALDVARLRIEKWKGDSGDKQQSQANADSVQRNMTAALPAITSNVRTAPQDFAATFKLYRNLNALYDVFKTLTQAAGAFGPKQDYQTLAPYADAIDGYRRSVGDYMENLAAAKDAELARLRSQARPSQNAVESRKVIIDDNGPAPRKSAKRKPHKAAPPPTNPQ